MAEETPYAQGTPCWVDLSTRDTSAARDFYGALLGWDFIEGPPDTHGYTMATVDDALVAGLFSPPDADAPAVWTVYLSVTDAEETAGRVTEHGGRLLTDVMDVPGEGRMWIAADPTGAVFGGWQPGRHRGAELVNQPGAMVWHELASNDVATAREFYSKVFGVRFGEAMSPTFDYRVFSADGHDAGGSMPTDLPSHWRTYFGVRDTDAAVKTLTELGGEVLHGPDDSPYGRVTACRDPEGAAFVLLSRPVRV
ncbi:VOC family protein [Streptomyces sp. NPDC049577]|uniref:VOC family protein n=1 Tax=Streptomyces sp. NPDC049577 TaxID=3155153 RepID=UPI0034200F55